MYDWDSPWGVPVDDFFATRQAIPALLGVFYPYTPSGLYPFIPVPRGADPDRMVAEHPHAMWGQSVDLVIPFGSDLDQDGTVTLDWRVQGDPEWYQGTLVNRADGYYTATLQLTSLQNYEFRASFEDPDHVQSGETLTDSLSLVSVLEPYQFFLSVVFK